MKDRHVDGGAWNTRPLRLSKKGRDTEATGDVCVNETSLRRCVKSGFEGTQGTPAVRFSEDWEL